jgi:hypothetical protein
MIGIGIEVVCNVLLDTWAILLVGAREYEVEGRRLNGFDPEQFPGLLRPDHAVGNEVVFPDAHLRRL